MKARLWMGALSVALVVFQMGTAQAQTGVSDDRVSLPEGPGSLEGIGENVSLSPNMGTMGYGINIQVPSGFAGVTPSVRLAYSSGAGSSVVGVGWSMPVPNIERSTFKGLPEYNRQDTFTADGGSQLVEVPGQAVPTYRARYEGGFVRYTWHEAGDGREGFWRAEYPDGRVATFGARADGTLVPEARVSGDEGTFRYMMVEMVDVYGHSMRYTYEKFGAVALVRQIGYVYTNGPDQPRYSLSFQYEERRDEGGFDFLSDAKPGFDERLEQRLTAVNVFSGDERIRRYEVSYEPYAESGGFTRLSQVEVFGLEGGLYPAVQKFNYSRTLEGVCDQGDDCEQPFVIDMGNIGVNIGVGKATLVDINGDALPDIIDTTDDGAHRFLLNIADSDSRPRFSEQTVESAIGTGSGFRLGTPFVQVLDVNGDGFADLLNSGTGRALLNRGAGDWVDAVELSDTGEVSDALGTDFDLGEGGLRNLRFVDLNNDKRIDLMRSTRQTTSMWLNMGPEGFQEDESVELLEYDLLVDDIQMTDMNGDGLLDPVRLSVGGLRYKLNLGRGKWSDEIEVVGLPIEESELELASLDDLNGDGLADLVIVVGRQVKFAINRNGTTFSQITTLTSDTVSGELPLRDATVTVVMADINGNGSTDVVWLDSQGQVTALELFPVRPNQMSRIENSLGKRTDVFYSTSVQQMARDPQPWAYTLPHPMLVVERLERTDLLTNITETTTYRYRDGFYDGDEKQFRGYAMVEILSEGDDTQEEGLQIDTYDVGAEDTYRNGLMLGMRMLSGGRVINEKTFTYEDCPVAETGTTEPAIRYVCNTEATTIIQEGTEEAEHVTLRQRSTYDGYGNVTLSEALGVVAVGGGACEPCGDRGEDEFRGACGAECKGDEFFVETNYVQPGEDTNGRWIISTPFRTSEYGDPDSALKTETLYYYDGAPFEGLALGSLDQGNISRTTVKREVGSDDVITMGRYRYDDHGNVIETLDPLATPESHAHRSIVVLDEDQLRVVQQDLLLEDASGQPYRLRREVQYEPVFDKVVEATAWMRTDAQGQTLDSRRSTAFTYDEFGRLTSIIRPGDDVGTPTDTFTYDLGNPTSRIISQTRSQSAGAMDIETIQCFDGRGRVFQTRTRLEDGLYQVSGFSLFNLNSKPFRIYQPYTSPSSECDEEPPSGVLFAEMKRDALDRLVRSSVPDADIYGEASVATTEYAPLITISADQEDNDPTSPHAGTPSTARVDGLGRLLVSERILADGTVGGISAVYDGLGHITQAIDAEGNVKHQSYDLLGRVLRVDDPNKPNATTYQYDDVGMITAIEDGRGAIVRSKYDGMNRLVEQWDDADRDGTLITWTWDHDPNCDPALCTNTASLPVRTESPNLNQDGRNTTLFGYDARGRSVTTEQILEGVAMTFEVGYDNASRIISSTYPNGRTIDFRYDGADRLTAVDGILSDVDYDGRGLPRSVRYGDGSTINNRFDSLLRLASREVTNASGEVLQGFSYTRDRAGNILTVEDLATVPGPNNNAVFTYDAWYRNIGAQLAVTSPELEEIINSTFSPNGKVLNRTSSLDNTGIQTGEYSYDSAAPNALTRAGTMELTYDAAGYANQRGSERFDWDAQGRLRSITDQATDEAIARFAYGTDHTRVVKVEGDSTTLYPHPSFELRDGISTLYIKLGNSRIARIQDDALATTALSDLAPLNAQASESQTDGQINAADAWLAVALRDELLDVAAEEEPSSVGALLQSSLRRMFMERDAEVTFLYHDHLGSITMATRGDTGEVEGKRAFYPTGAERESFGYVDEYGFTGQELDRATGLLHFGHRYFDPTTGHWISADPLFAITSLSDLSVSGEALNTYGYVGHNYPNSTDPDGLNGSNTAGNAAGGNAGNQGGGGGGGGAAQNKIKEGFKKVCATCKKGLKTGGDKAKKGLIKAKNNAKSLAKKANNKVKNGTTRELSSLSDGELQGIVDNVNQRIQKIHSRPKRNKRLKQAELAVRIIFEATEIGVAAAETGTGFGAVVGVTGIGLGVATIIHDSALAYKITKADPSTPEGQEILANNLPALTKGLVSLLEGRRTRAQNILDERRANPPPNP